MSVSGMKREERRYQMAKTRRDQGGVLPLAPPPLPVSPPTPPTSPPPVPTTLPSPGRLWDGNRRGVIK